MSYLVLARKYRPETFAAVRGQEHVTRTLTNAIERDKIAHAYIFSGPRGVGKTSIARILAKSLNCAEGPTATPCLKCPSCLDITRGGSLAVREIDGASHNSVDNVRELIDSFRSLPAPGSKYKVYIIDEVHMLSMAAFNALLKSLEEPPPHTVFILATTEPHKIPDTVHSRCQRYDFRALPLDVVQAQLAEICDREEITYEPQALRMVARLSEGSMRDAQTLLDRVRSYCQNDISTSETSLALGAVDRKLLFDLSGAIFNRNATEVLSHLQTVFSLGSDPSLFLSELVTHFRELLVMKYGAKDAAVSFGISPDDEEELRQQVSTVESHDLQDLVQLIRVGADNALRSSYPKYATEALLIRAATREPVKEVGALLAALRSKETKKKELKAPTVETPTPKAVSARPQPKLAPKPKPNPIKPAKPQVSSEATKIVAHNGKHSWQGFVQYCREDISPLLGEQLRRIVPTEFECGKLIAEGQSFHISSVNEPESKQRLIEALTSYWPAAQGAEWQIKFRAVADGSQSEPGSMHHNEVEDDRKRRVKKKEEILAHPKIQSIKKAFPGSTIEKVRFNER